MNRTKPQFAYQGFRDSVLRKLYYEAKKHTDIISLIAFKSSYLLPLIDAIEGEENPLKKKLIWVYEDEEDKQALVKPLQKKQIAIDEDPSLEELPSLESKHILISKEQFFQREAIEKVRIGYITLLASGEDYQTDEYWLKEIKSLQEPVFFIFYKKAPSSLLNTIHEFYSFLHKPFLLMPSVEQSPLYQVPQCVFFLSEEEKLTFLLNHLLKDKQSRFFVFRDNREVFPLLLQTLHKYHIPYSLYKKTKINRSTRVILSDRYMPHSRDYFHHYLFFNLPTSWQDAKQAGPTYNRIIDVLSRIRTKPSLFVYCGEKEAEKLKAIEQTIGLPLAVGKIPKRFLEAPPVPPPPKPRPRRAPKERPKSRLKTFLQSILRIFR